MWRSLKIGGEVQCAYSTVRQESQRSRRVCTRSQLINAFLKQKHLKLKGMPSECHHYINEMGAAVVI